MATATLKQCAILVGGSGSRLGALTADTPKPVIPVAGRPFLAWLMRELQRYGVEEFLLLTSYLPARLEAEVRRIADDLPRRARIDFAEEPARAGTGGALYHAASRLHDRFLLCNGDSLFAGNIAALLRDAAGDRHATAARLLLRRLADTSRYGVVSIDGDRVAAFREKQATGLPGLINAGIYACNRTLLDHVSSNCSLEQDVMPRLAEAGLLAASIAEGWFIDIGIPQDLARAQTELPRRTSRRALFLDRDGVVNVDHGYVGSRERWEWMPGAVEAIRHATQHGWQVFIVTNQAGVARGLYDEAAVRDLLDMVGETARFAGGTIDDWRYCPDHPDGSIAAYRRASDWRKPAPGMLLDLMRAWELDPAQCEMIGDKDTDMQAAAAAGIAGHLFTGGDLLGFVRRLIGDRDGVIG